MRIKQLDLIAFGHFTNQSIDLSQGNYGLHIIYGANEAGKSTTLRALTALLFDFPHRTDDNFKHENKHLRVGATLENRGGKQLVCVRRKARSATLLFAESSEEVPATVWNQFLPKIQEDQFLRMFGINHVSLREGGAELVRGGGDSGQALFSSATGIANLQQKRARLESQIEELYGKSGRKGRLYDNLKDYKALRDEEKKVSLSMDRWHGIQNQLSVSNQQIEGYKTQLDSLHRKLLDYERIQRSIPLVRNYIEKTKALAALGQTSKLPDEFEQDVQDAYKKKGEKEVSIQRIEDELRNLELNLAQIPVRFWSEEQKLQVDKLISGLGLYLQSLENLPKLTDNRKQLDRQVERKWQEIGPSESLKARLQSQRIPTSEKKLIESLASQYESYERQINDAKSRLSKLRRKLQDESSLQVEQLSPESISLLEQRLHSARPLATRIQELSHLERDSEHSLMRIEQGIRKWNLVVADMDELIQLPTVSSSSIDRWQKELDKRQDAIDKAREKLDASIQKRASKQREFDRQAKKQRVPTRHEWDLSKQARDEAFRLLSENREATTERWNEFVHDFQQFEQNADQIATDLLDQADLVAAREQLQDLLDDLQAQVDECTRELSSYQAQYDKSDSDWQAYLAEHKIAAENPSAALDWVQAVSQLQRDAQDFQDKKYRAEQMRKAIADAHVELQAGLVACGSTIAQHEDFGILLESAEEVLRKASRDQGEASAFRKQRQSDQWECDEQTHNLEELESRFAEFKERWLRALASIALPPNATPMEVRVIMDQISELQLTVDEIKSTQADIEQCTGRIEGYEESVGAAFEWLSSRNPEAVTEVSKQADAEYLVGFLERYGNQVSNDQSRRESLVHLQEQARQRLQEVCQQYKLIQNQLQEMIEQADAGSEVRLLELARNSRQFHLLDTDCKQLRDRLQDECNNLDIEPFIKRVQQADADDLVIGINDLREQIAQLDRKREEEIRIASGLERDFQNLDTGGKASLLATRASGVGVQIEERVQELAILRLASAALTAGIERYRSANEDPILKLASESFREMTQGRFRGIEIALDNDGKHLLVGRRSEDGPGGEVAVEQMSDGTRDQLYLALRLASLRQWNTVHEPLPLVVDDILIHFDDERSVQTLKQLVSLSDQTQVIFFTHHQHLVELAKKSLPSDQVFFHEMPGAT